MPDEKDYSQHQSLIVVRQAAAAATKARQAFEDAIRDAHPDETVRAIATAAGLSPSRVHQIIQEGEAT